MISEDILKPFKDGKIKMTVRFSNTGPMVGLEPKADNVDLDQSMTQTIQDQYQHIAKQLGVILYENDNPDKAYQFGKEINRQTRRNPQITKEQLFDVIEFADLSETELKKYAQFAELYPQANYPEGVDPIVATALEDKHGANAAREIISKIDESDKTLTDSAAKTWYDAESYELPEICEKIEHTKAKDKVRSVQVVYLLEAEKPPTKDEIEEYLPEENTANKENGDESSVDKLEMKQPETQQDDDQNNNSKKEGTLPEFNSHVNALKEKYGEESAEYEYELGTLIKEYNEEFNLTLEEIAESDSVDRSSSFVSQLKKVTSEFTKDEYPKTIPSGHIYTLRSRIGDESNINERLQKADEINDVSLNTASVLYVTSADEVTIADAAEDITGYTDEEIVGRIEMAYLLNGQSPPPTGEIYAELGSTPPETKANAEEELEEQPENNESQDDTEPTSTNSTEQGSTDSKSDGDTLQEPNNTPQGQQAPNESQTDSSVETEENVVDPTEIDTPFTQAVADRFLHSEYAAKIVNQDDIDYDENTQTLSPKKRSKKEDIASNTGEFVPSQSALDGIQRVITNKTNHTTIITETDLTEESVSVSESITDILDLLSRNTTVEDINLTDTGGLYTIKQHTDDPLIIYWPIDDEKTAMAIETYANNGGDRVILIGQRNNNSQPTINTIDALEDNFSLQKTIPTIQWKENSDAVFIYE